MASGSENVDQSPVPDFQTQVTSFLQSLRADMQSMSTEMQSISGRLSKIEERADEDESETQASAPEGPAQRAFTDCSTPKESSSMSWADTMEREDPIEGSSMDIDGEGEEHDARGMRLFSLVERTESLIRPHFSAPLSNSARRSIVERSGKPILACASAPYLDKVLKVRLPAPVRTRDNELAKYQAQTLDALAPIAKILNDCCSGQQDLPDSVVEHLLSSVRLLGNVSSHYNRQRRSLVLQCLNPGIADMAEEDKLFSDAGIRLFGEGFSKKAKERDDELKTFSKIDQRRAPNGGHSAAATSSSSFPRAKHHSGKFRRPYTSGRGKPRFGPYHSSASSRKDESRK